MQIHQLTLQVPKTAYISEDKYAPYYDNSHVELEQRPVDEAFSKPQRTSKEAYKSEYDGFRYVYLQKSTI